MSKPMKRKPGRPRVRPVKERKMTVHLSIVEADRVKADAHSAGMSAAQWMREILIAATTNPK